MPGFSYNIYLIALCILHKQYNYDCVVTNTTLAELTANNENLKINCARWQASAAVELNSSVFWDVTQRKLV
jgi:hypothetical protein